MKQLRNVAIIGAGFSGHIAAASLAPLAERITVFSAKSANANEQARFRNQHCHFLMAEGFRRLRELISISTGDPSKVDGLLKEAGLEEIDGIGQFSVFVEGQQLPLKSSDLRTAAGSWVQYLKFAQGLSTSFSNVDIVHSTKVSSVLDQGESMAVVFQVEGREAETQSFDLVIDCSGINDRSPAHLSSVIQKLDLDETAVASRINYRSQRFHLNSAPTNSRRIFSVASGKETPHGCLVVFEGERDFLFTFSDSSSQPAQIELSLTEALKYVEHPEVAHLLANSSPVSPIWKYSKDRSYLRTVRSSTTRLTLFGDGRVSLNPLYGEGMSMTLEMAAHLRSFGESVNAGTPMRAAIDRLERELNQVSSHWFRRSASMARPALPKRAAHKRLFASLSTRLYFIWISTARPNALKSLWSKIHRTKTNTWSFTKELNS